MGPEDFFTMIITAVVTGGFSAATTVIALKVHIVYLRESLARQEKAIERAHDRIDTIDHMLKTNRKNLT